MDQTIKLRVKDEIDTGIELTVLKLKDSLITIAVCFSEMIFRHRQENIANIFFTATAVFPSSKQS